LRRFARVETGAERCELCGAAIGERHDHLYEPAAGRLACACIACGGRFEGGGGRLVRVVTQARPIAVELDDDEWSALAVPVALAFFLRSASGVVNAYFPGPAGTTSSPLDDGVWLALSDLHAELPALAPDGQAVLVSRLAGASGAWVVSIDLCYQLAGMLRTRWRGISGGEEARAAVAAFFREVSA